MFIVRCYIYINIFFLFSLLFSFLSFYLVIFFFLMLRRPPRSTRTDTLFPYTTLFRSYIEAQLAIEQVSLEACFDIVNIFRLEGWSDRVSQIPPPSHGGAARLRIYEHRVVHFVIKASRPGRIIKIDIARTVAGAARDVPLICRNRTFQRVTIQPSVQHQLAAVPRIAQPAGCSQPVGKMIVDLAINSLGNAAGITRGIAKNLG